MIIRGGENIYPKEIEAVVHQLPEIAEAAVVGRAHPVYGEEPVLFVSCIPAPPTRRRRIREHLRAIVCRNQTPGRDHDSRRPPEKPGRQDRQTHAAATPSRKPLNPQTTVTSLTIA